MSDITIDMLRQIQARLEVLPLIERRLASLEARVVAIESLVTTGNARLEAHLELTDMKIAVNTAGITGVNTRALTIAAQLERAVSREREIQDLRARLDRLEARDPQPR